MSRSRRTRRLVGAALLLVLVLLAIHYGREHSRGERMPDSPAAAANDAPKRRLPTDVEGPPDPRRAVGPNGEQPPGPPPSDPIGAPLQPEGPPPYPPGSQPLTEGMDPATTMAEEQPVDDGGSIKAIFGPRKDVVHPPDPLVLDLRIEDSHGKRLAVSNAVAIFHSERAPQDDPGFQAPFLDDGKGADKVSGDLGYATTYLPTARERDALIGYRIFVVVAFDAPKGLGHRAYVTSMEYTPRPNAILNGKFTEDVAGGSLVVGAGVTVNEAGQYKVIASLYAADKETALVFAQKSVPLEAGEQSIPLTFFGKILYDRGVDGPYVLRYMMLFQEFPDRGMYYPGDTLDDAYTTKPYRAKDFSDDPYVAPPPSGPVITADSPSQQGLPPPVKSEADRNAVAMPVKPEAPEQDPTVIQRK